MAELPSGTVSFLFTDIEGSTRLLKQLRAGYGKVLAEHQELLGAAFAAHGGQVVDTQGDSFFVAFRRAKDAVSAAVAAQRALAGHEWSEGIELRVRMGIHTGQAEASGGRYHGLAVHRASRIGDSAHGGQVLVSQTTRDLLDDEEEESAGVELRDLGEQRLKDLDRPVRLYQLAVEGLPSEFPPLRTVTSELEPEEPVLVIAPFWKRRLRVVVPLAAVVVAGAAAAGVLLSRGSGSAQAAAGVAADSVGVFNAPSGKPIAQVAVRTGPSAVAVGDGSVWVANVDAHAVSRIDPRTNASVQTIQVGNAPSGIAVGGGFVWVANSFDGTVSRIDPKTNLVVQTIPVGSAPAGVAFGEGGVWVANSRDRTVARIDPRSGAVRRRIAVDAGADAIAVGEGSLWVTSAPTGSVARIDPRSGGVQTINVGHGPVAVAVGSGSVWIANSLDDTVSRIDPSSNEVKATIEVGAGPSAISVVRDIVWVSNEQGGTLSRIDPSRNAVVDTIETRNRPEGVALSKDTMYVAVRTSGLAHRGGTLAVVAGDVAPGIDPAVEYNSVSWALLILTNDGLVAFRRVGGSDGARLVPDLATSIPTPTEGGKTYTFQVRTGIRYSTGALVQPADFRRAIERVLAQPGPIYFTNIVGADACARRPKHCDLSKGVVADPESNTVTFHLIAPDPDFLYKLALPFAFAVPSGTPIKARLPLPATGPYLIASFNRKHGLRLVRNQHFHEWSAAAQPNGYPDTIVWRFGASPQTQTLAVEQGKADLTSDVGLVASGHLTELRTRYASQLHLNPILSTGYLFLNTRLPPFDDVRVRQALNFAVDRDRLVELQGGRELNQTSCQVLPPNLDGYRRYCPYTRDPSPSGSYTGPDWAKARRLVDGSGTKGQTVTVWSTGRFPSRGGTYIVSVLRRLGYRARLKVVTGDVSAYFEAVLDSRRKAQAGNGGWVADWASASGFIPAQLTCHSYLPRNKNNANLAEFCDPRIDAEIARARALQVSDPQAASALWAKIDHDITDQAPLVTFESGLAADFVSRRVGNYQYSPQSGVLLDQLWVR